MRFDALIITNLPNYYKRNLFNKIGERCSLYVVFIGGTQKQRNANFLNLGEEVNFEYVVLNQSLDTRSYIQSCWRLYKVLTGNSFGRLILGEWVNIEYWFSLLFFKKNNSSMMLESSIHSVKGFGIKELAKAIFLKNLDAVFANGKKHAELAQFLNFEGKVFRTNGLGIINYGLEEKEVERGNDFLYVGRLSPEKNLDTLIKVFNNLPYQLTIIGEGAEYNKLKSISNSNIHFQGYVKNEELARYYRSCRAFVLISKDEPYGLVAEEALYFGAPVIISSVCGIVETHCFHQKNALVVDASDKEAIGQAVGEMMNDDVYRQLCSNCNREDIVRKDNLQVQLYVDWIKNGIV